ncbi:MAG: transcriptional regulator [Candidatus Aenigmatarchaeota archaeon]|nr:MAG: transcriptional regulator [Candidatus Aenigmarchaeota archaeon]
MQEELRLAGNILGEIILAERPEKVMKKWRRIFKISQKELAKELRVSPSVISDYESGRRKSPGISVLKRYVMGLIAIDKKRGGEVLKSFIQPQADLNRVLLDRRDFDSAVSIRRFCQRIKAKLIVKGEGDIFGYSIIDSVKAITQLEYSELAKLYGLTHQRALIFTNISRGRTPLVAIKIAGLKPGLVVLHGINRVDEIAKTIAEAEGIALALCPLEDIERVKEGLRGL